MECQDNRADGEGYLMEYCGEERQHVQAVLQLRQWQQIGLKYAILLCETFENIGVVVVVVVQVAILQNKRENTCEGMRTRAFLDQKVGWGEGRAVHDG